jgi:hypothetical protein
LIRMQGLESAGRWVLQKGELVSFAV